MSVSDTGARGVVFRPKQARFLTIPQSPLCYWLRERFFDLLAGPTLGDVADVVQGLATANDPRFVRFVWEVPLREWSREIRARRWVPFEKGGGYGKWFGHHFWAVDWAHNGARLKAFPGSVIRNEHQYFKPGWTYSDFARGSVGPRVIMDSMFSSQSPGALTGQTCYPVGAILACRVTSYVVRLISAQVNHLRGYVARFPVPTVPINLVARFEDICMKLKSSLVCREMAERTFTPFVVERVMLAEAAISVEARSEAIAGLLHAAEGQCEWNVFMAYGVAGDDLGGVLEETGAPAGWYPLIVGYHSLPLLSNELIVDAELLALLIDRRRIDLSSGELAGLKHRLRRLYEAGSGSSPLANEEPESSDEENEEELESGAHIPIPPETFLEELSQKLEIHPISVYWLLRELREKDGVVCLPELRRFVSDHFSVIVLRMLGHRWPRQVEANEEIPEWAEPSGIIPVTEGAGADSLISRVRERIAADFGAGQVSAIEREFEEIMGMPLETWLARDFYRNHISQFRKRPVAWQLQSTLEASNIGGKRSRRKGDTPSLALPNVKKWGRGAERAPVFSCLVYYHRLDGQLLGAIRTQYAHPMRLRMETELRELERIDAETRTREQEERRAELIIRIEELKDFEARLERAEEPGFDSDALNKIADKEPLDKWTSRDGKQEHPLERDAFNAQEKRYDPDINDGVRVNIAPLQKAGLLAADVLAAKDVDKAISDRAQWRADERRWCREGKLPHPGWWN